MIWKSSNCKRNTRPVCSYERKTEWAKKELDENILFLEITSESISLDEIPTREMPLFMIHTLPLHNHDSNLYSNDLW